MKKRILPAVLLLAVSLLLTLPMLDTAGQYMAEEVLRYPRDYLLILLSILTVAFVIQFCLRNRRRLRWLLPVLSALLLAGAEVFWLMGGWNRILSIFLWGGGFPMMVGSCAVLLLAELPGQKPSVQAVAALAVTVAAVCAVVFWPRPLGDKLDLRPREDILYFDEDGSSAWLRARDSEELLSLLTTAKVTPCLSAPPWDEGQGILLWLDDCRVLAAPHNDTPYIYEYAGPLEEFDGADPVWRVFGYPALYSELRAASNWADR